MMTTRDTLKLALAASCAAIATPAIAQAPQMGYEERVYEFPQPPAGHAGPVPAPPAVYDSRAVVQPVPGAEPFAYPAPTAPAYYEPADRPDVIEAVPPAGYQRSYVAPAYGAPVAPPVARPPVLRPPVPVGFPDEDGDYRDAREEWLDECRDRLGVGRRERGGVIGGLLGAVAGGVAGNRIYDSERLAGSLIGAGVGGLAGLAIGSAIAGSGDRRRIDRCEAYLLDYDRQSRGYHEAPGYGAYGAYQGHTGYVPVMVAVPQQRVVREYVTVEYVDAPPPPAPAPSKRVRYIKGR